MPMMSLVDSAREIGSKLLLLRAFISRPPLCGTAGFALLIVLWWMALLALVVMQLLAAGRNETAIVANLRNSAIAEAVADGAVHRAIFQVLASRWDADGTPHTVRTAQGAAVVTITDEGKKIDPNIAPAAVMEGLLRACGANARVAGPLARAIVEWRSIDGLRSPDAKRQPYQAAGLGYLPPSRRFVSDDELGLVLGMSPALLACIAPHISIHSLSVPSLGTTDDRLVRQAIADAYPAEAAQPVEASAEGVSVVLISASATGVGGGNFRRTAVVRVARRTLDERFAYRILEWRGD
jgi:general secretion pathway protein K